MPDRASIAALILDRPVCLECIATKATLTLLAADEELTALGKLIRVDSRPRSRCRNCGGITLTYCIGERPEI
jgi:hypothetical protein